VFIILSTLPIIAPGAHDETENREAGQAWSPLDRTHRPGATAFTPPQE
jgi:hypothetical protein